MKASATSGSSPGGAPANAASELGRRLERGHVGGALLLGGAEADVDVGAERLRDLLAEEAADAAPVDAAHELADQPAEGERVIARAGRARTHGSAAASAVAHRRPSRRASSGGSGARSAGRPARCESSQRTGIASLPRCANSGQ